MSNEINIKGIDKAELLAGLFNRSKPLGLGFLNANPDPMTVDTARAIVAQGKLSFDYLEGRVMKVNLAGDTFFPGAYDRDVGKGAAQAVVDAIRAGQPAPTNPDSLAGDLEALIAKAKPSTVRGNVFELGIEEFAPALEMRRVDFRPNTVTERKSFAPKPAEQKERLTLDMSFPEIIEALSDRDTRSSKVLVEIAKTVPQIDPFSMPMGGIDLMCMLNVDSLGLYGAKAHVLHHDICEGNIEKTATVVRGWQLGIVSKEEIHKSIDLATLSRPPYGLDVDDIVRKVQDRLPGYKKIVPDVAGGRSNSQEGPAPK